MWCYTCGDKIERTCMTCASADREPLAPVNVATRRAPPFGLMLAVNWVAVVGLGLIFIIVCAFLAAASAV